MVRCLIRSHHQEYKPASMNEDAEGMCNSVASLEPDPRYSGCCSNIFRPGRVVRDLVVGGLVVLGVAVVIAVVFVVCFFFIPAKSEGETSLLSEEGAFHGPYRGITEVEFNNNTRYDVDPKLERVKAGEHEGHDHGHEGHDHDGHSHDHDGHSHDHDGHSHDHDGHSHDHDGHSHDHDGHSHDHKGHSHDHKGHKEHHHVGPVPEPESEPEPEPEAEAEPEPEPTAETEPEPEAEATAEPEPEPESDHTHGKGPVTHDHTHPEADHDHTHPEADHDHTHPVMNHDHTHPEADHDHTHPEADHDHTHHDMGHEHGPATHDHTHPEMDHDHTHPDADHDHTHHDHTHEQGPAAHDHTHPEMDHDHTHPDMDHDHTHPGMDHEHTPKGPVTHDHTHPEMDHDHTHPEMDHDHTHPADGTVDHAEPQPHHVPQASESEVTHVPATHEREGSLPPLFDLFSPRTPTEEPAHEGSEGTLKELVIPHGHEDETHTEEAHGVTEAEITEVPLGKCRPRQLEMCSDLPHSLTAFPNWAGDQTEEDLHQTSLPFLRDVIVRSRCSPRAKEYSCAILEPPCTPAGTILPPCRTFCKSVASTCQEFITSRFSLSSAFDCEQFPDSSDPSVCFDMTHEPCLGLEHRCGDGRCVAKRLVCDGHSDCLDRSDEAVCPGQGSDSVPGDNTTSMTPTPEETDVTEPTLQEETTTLPQESETILPNQCPELQCLDGTCISLSQVNDGVVDCPEGIDEEDFKGLI